MMDEKKVSVIVPVYNSSKYLAECLDSIVNQTYRNMEILCVDDESKDNSVDIIKKYQDKDKRISIFQKKNEGKGAASARNMGLSNATGDFVIFLDSDDFFELDMIEQMLTKAEKTCSDLVICGADKFDQELNCITGIYEKIELKKAPERESFSYKDCPDCIFQIGDWVTWNKLYKKELLIDNDLRFEAIPISDDQYVTTLAMVFAKKISIVDKCLIHYRYNTGVSQVDGQAKHPEAAYAAFPSVVSVLKNVGIYDSVKRSYINMAMRLMRWFFDVVKTYSDLKMLYDIYIGQIFKMLNAEELDMDYFDDYRTFEWYQMINNHSLEDILFMTVRASGTAMNTAVLRFKAPVDTLNKGDKVIIIGRGIAGRYWYSQLLLRNEVEVIGWYDEEGQIPPNIGNYVVLKAK